MNPQHPAGQVIREGVESFWARMVRDHRLTGRLSYPAFLARAAADRPEKPALIHADRTHSYRELYAAIHGVADALARDFGITAGDRVALLLDNSDIYDIWYLAILAMGAMAVPLNTKLTAHEIEYILADAGVRLLIHEAVHAEVVAGLDAALRKRLACFTLDREQPPSAPADSSPAELLAGFMAMAPDVETPAAIYYTSGTTGKPKGVVHTHRSFIAAALQAPLAWEYADPETINLATTPLFHIANHTVYLPTLAVGGTLVIDTFGTARAFELIERHRVSQFFAVPSMLLMMVQHPERDQHDTRSVRRVLFGAAPMPVSKLEAVQELFPKAVLLHGMGQTECSGTTVTLPSDQAFAKAGSVGINIPGTEIRIVDDQDGELPPNSVGELVTRGPNVMSHYLNRAEATAETLRGGWLHTGDLGYRDEAGYVYLVDRKKDMIIRGGENIYSTEVESVLYQLPEVAQAAVIGMPSELFGEEVLAFLVLKEGCSCPSLDAIQAHCRSRLARFKIPVAIEFLDNMPQTATGKIQKHELKMLVKPSGRPTS
ncbi:MAG: fatty-acid--CoA ligase [Betaproteobacteria bacterium]|nr:long-chain-fatty-acid--CoA ligase [Rhodocyclaceae bacterium]MCG3185611.1 Long-chain-fatty-acid--CoA ligase [Rhodocyclaceae bacterium]